MTSAPLYTLRDVRQVYGARTVLDIPALTVQRGEVLAVVGPSGAGKSTLLRLMALLEAPAQGEMLLHLNDERVTAETASIAQRRLLAMVFQRPALLSRNVRANVAYGLRLRGERNGQKRVEAALERVSLTHLANAHPRTLSGGEMQRVAVARALVLEPRVLLLDEPTANLDPYNVRLIESLIREQHTAHETTIILVTHNIFQARRLATRVVLLLEGALIEEGSAEEFFDSPRDPRTAAFLSGEFVY
ncbi:MAG: ATP-binding cassette domain-containing protein [Anaerolineae bacterium]|nr:ATP-binding cassette domain-containing protein [Anaerolineae bacterium]MEB2288110.1 ATP-binding cassette domain-containing protein [Anaerolineae bacterium]